MNVLFLLLGYVAALFCEAVSTKRGGFLVGVLISVSIAWALV